MTKPQPRCLILAGPNGAGKSTHASAIVSGLHGIDRFINADTIAAGIAGFAYASATFEAGRIALRSIDQAIAERADFAFETTLSGRRWPQLHDRLEAAGYACLVNYLWLPTAELSLARVQQRVKAGGHDIPETDILRRHAASAQSFLEYFVPRASKWQLFNSSADAGLALIADGGDGRATHVIDAEQWDQFIATAKRSTVRERAAITYSAAPILIPATEATMDENQQAPALSSFDTVTTEQVIEASRLAVRRALAIQRALGIGAAVMRDGKVVIIPPEELPLTAY
jgi:predicted ABC-type ATPase